MSNWLSARFFLFRFLKTHQQAIEWKRPFRIISFSCVKTLVASAGRNNEFRFFFHCFQSFLATIFNWRFVCIRPPQIYTSRPSSPMNIIKKGPWKRIATHKISINSMELNLIIFSHCCHRLVRASRIHISYEIQPGIFGVAFFLCENIFIFQLLLVCVQQCQRCGTKHQTTHRTAQSDWIIN